MAGSLAMAPAALAQNAYPTPEAAADALVDGIARNDGDAVKAVVGPDYRKYIPAENMDPEDVTNFLEAWAKAHAIVPAGADKAFLGVGQERLDAADSDREDRRRLAASTPRALPTRCAFAASAATSSRRSRWRSPTPTRRTSITRATGMATASRNTRSAVCRRPASATGCTGRRCPASPRARSAPEFADAKAGQPYHGYLYKILTAQGKDAPGGARSYIKNGRMTEGYALVAWPAKYDDTGVMTFIVNQDGVVYQKNLGAGHRRGGPRDRRLQPGRELDQGRSGEVTADRRDDAMTTNRWDAQ